MAEQTISAEALAEQKRKEAYFTASGEDQELACCNRRHDGVGCISCGFFDCQRTKDATNEPAVRRCSSRRVAVTCVLDVGGYEVTYVCH